MKGSCCLFFAVTVILLVCAIAEKTQTHNLVKRQSPQRSSPQRTFPLSRSRQFPPPEELEDSEDESLISEEEEQEAGRRDIPPFRGRQPPPSEDEYSDEEYSYTEAPKTTTPTPARPTARAIVFNNRFQGRQRFGANAPSSTTTTTSRPSTAASSRFRSTPAQSQRLDVIANVVNPSQPKPSPRSISLSRPASQNTETKAEPPTNDSARRNGTSRVRTRGRFRTRTSTSTTTTTTTTTPPPEEYYYYYEDEEQKNEPIATTTTTTTPRPTFARRPTNARRPSGTRIRSTAKPVVKFDPDSQFVPPPEDVATLPPAPAKKFTTTSTVAPSPGAIPAHLRSKYRERTDGRFIDFLRDPNKPRELKNYDLTDYPFYIRVPEDIEFDCNEIKDGYYASVPHHCQLFHYCFAGSRYDFLCANYTLYDQTTFTCRFAINVDCPSSAKFFYRNDELWKETTTVAPTNPPRAQRKRITPKDDDYEDEYDYDEDYEDEEIERRRRPKRRRNRRKNRRRPSASEE